MSETSQFLLYYQGEADIARYAIRTTETNLSFLFDRFKQTNTVVSFLQDFVDNPQIIHILPKDSSVEQKLVLDIPYCHKWIIQLVSRTSEPLVEITVIRETEKAIIPVAPFWPNNISLAQAMLQGLWDKSVLPEDLCNNRVIWEEEEDCMEKQVSLTWETDYLEDSWYQIIYKPICKP
jgi:hypothetical protein